VTYKDQMIRHLQAAELRDKQVDKIESAALRKLDLDPDGLDRIGAYRIKKELEPNELLKQRAGSRNYHVAMATMYGIAALVEEAGS
jgi:hypothetical protein